jgi:hypothetical protein
LGGFAWLATGQQCGGDKQEESNVSYVHDTLIYAKTAGCSQIQSNLNLPM